MDTNTFVVLVILVVVLIFILQRNSCQEDYGQDASIRASTGWLAGPKGLYGYDPIDHFADQIAAMEKRNVVSSPLEGVGPEEYTTGSQKKCGSCMSTEDFEM